MNIIIAGDGEVGFYLAEALVDSNHNITIVDPHEDLLKMVEAHTDLMAITGDSTSIEVLKNANVKKADLLKHFRRFFRCGSGWPRRLLPVTTRARRHSFAGTTKSPRGSGWRSANADINRLNTILACFIRLAWASIRMTSRHQNGFAGRLIAASRPRR